MRGSILAGFVLTALALVGSAAAAPAEVVLRVGESHAFTGTTLWAGAAVKCVHEGHILSLSNPRNASPWLAQGAVWTTPGARAFHLYLTAEPFGRYEASCGIGGSHW